MKRRCISRWRSGVGVCGLLGLFWMAGGLVCGAAEPSPAAISAFDAYVRGVEARLAEQHRARTEFIASAGVGAESDRRLRQGELIVEKLTPLDWSSEGAMLHHWRGTAFAPGATAADFERLMKDFDGYPKSFAPQVVRARVLAQDGDRVQAVMRVRQQHVITVVMDTAYDVTFARLDARRGWSISRSTQIEEIDGAGSKRERVLSGAEEHGFLWRLNTHWSYEERDGGLYMQIESVSLTRAVPRGLGWVVGPFVESVPRESLEFTLRAVCGAIRK
ncbi:MAG: hypothetical protein ABR923_19675 [Terracidiphilus sp.]